MKLPPATCLWLCWMFVTRLQAAPLQLNPENPHYFLFHNKPMLVVTSGEHYGAIINTEFNFDKYLQTLAWDGLNGTRTWAGAYCEPPSAFNIADNTLAPHPRKFLCPWARSGQPGYANGGNKFDLSKWDSAYFGRLTRFLKEASARGIIVELNLFCPFYEENMWALSPMNASNNINGVGTVARTNVYTLDKNGGLLAFQDAMVRKIVTELKGFDNLYYEICNEPYFGGVTAEWQQHVSEVIRQTEAGFQKQHLISQNIASYSSEVSNPNPAVSILNFHYASPPDAVQANYRLNRVIGDNETGFRGTNDSIYRMEAWDFITAGGGLFNNLDYSFTAGHEDGTYLYPGSQPGGGSPQLRRQLGFLKRLVESLDFIHMHPDAGVVRANLPESASVRALAKPGEAYIVYLRTGLGERKRQKEWKTNFAAGEMSLDLNLPSGSFVTEWIDTRTGTTGQRTTISIEAGRPKVLSVPEFQDDIALTIRRNAAR